MTILQKDMGPEVAVTVGATGGNAAYTTSSTSTSTSRDIGATSTIPDPIWDATTPTGEANYDRTGQPKGIYLARNSEVYTLIESLFPGMREPGRSIYFNAYKYKVSPGEPLYIWPGGWYIALWNGLAGIGYYIFVGYDPSNHPTQTFTLTPSWQTYATINTTGNGTATTDPNNNSSEELTDEEEEEDAARTVIFGTGYDGGGGGYDPDTGVAWRIVNGKRITSDGRYFVEPTTSLGTKINTTTYVPASSATSGVSQSLTASQMQRMLNVGWNSWARSINPVSIGKYLIFKTMAGITSGMLALGPKGMEGRGLGEFFFSLIVDSEGLKVHEKGEVVHTLKAGQQAISAIRIYRHLDNTIHYVVTTGTTTVVYKSLEPNQFPNFIPLYVYGYLYTSGDTITEASIPSGEIHYGSI